MGPCDDPLGERRPLNQLHHQRMYPVRVLESVDVRDIGMVERRQHLRFAAEPRQPLRVVGEQVRQNFDRDVTVQLGVACPIDLTHAARPEGGTNFVRAEASSGRQRHEAPDDRLALIVVDWDLPQIRSAAVIGS